MDNSCLFKIVMYICKVINNEKLKVMKAFRYNKRKMYNGVKYQIKEINENLFEITINGKKYDDEEIPYMYETNLLQAIRSCETIIRDNIYFK